MGFTKKSNFYQGVGGVTKNQYKGENYLKREGLGQFADLRGGLARKRRVMFLRKEEEVDILRDTMTK